MRIQPHFAMEHLRNQWLIDFVSMDVFVDQQVQEGCKTGEESCCSWRNQAFPTGYGPEGSVGGRKPH